jgi:uncharacterized protein
MAGEISFFELGVGDPERARAFYSELFDWDFKPGPSDEEGGYAIKTPSLDGGLHGGDEGVWPYLFFKVEDMDVAIERVRALGGEVEREHEATEASEKQFGRFCFCRDDQGSRFGLHQPPRRA